MRISDWSSDVCSSDLGVVHRIGRQERLDHVARAGEGRGAYRVELERAGGRVGDDGDRRGGLGFFECRVGEVGQALEQREVGQDRKSVVEGKSVSVRGGLGGRRIIKKKKKRIIK